MARTAARLARDQADCWWRRRTDRSRSTHQAGGFPGGRLRNTLPTVPPQVLLVQEEWVRKVAARVLTHRFDLLGSGWVHVRHGINCPGVEGHRFAPGPAVTPDPEGRWLQGRTTPANLPESRRLWGLVAPGYQPIDWQIDFKSGFRWDETTWYRDVTYGTTPGADVKVPWELGRMQHLPWLAWAFALAEAGHEGFEPAEIYAYEFRNQVLDFMASNPPRFGVQWSSTMDVALRAVSWLVGWDLLRAHGAVFDEAFEQAFTRGVYLHGRHIATNLEWYPHLLGNHYLADVTGLAFVAAYLPRTPESDAWLAFACREVVRELGHQFHEEGSNFEASTSYHRLCGEMAVYAAALLLGLPQEKLAALREYDHQLAPPRPPLSPKPLPLYLSSDGRETPLPPSLLRRLRGIAEFASWATGPKGRTAQIGDNDNGRFLKLQPAWGVEWAEDQLDHRHLVASVAGLFPGSSLESEASESLDAAMTRGLSGGGVRPDPGWDGQITASTVLATASPGVWTGLRRRSFPGFGLHIWRSYRIWLAVRCGPVGQDGWGGHAHNDQLSFELWVNGEPLVVDPGTYLYTPARDLRNAFRSTGYHSTLSLVGQEQNSWGESRASLFVLEEHSRARTIEASDTGFVGEHQGFGAPHRRALRLEPWGLRGLDSCAASGPRRATFSLAPGAQARVMGDAEALVAAAGVRVRVVAEAGRINSAPGWYSPSYGLRQETHTLWCEAAEGDLSWRLEMLP